MLQIENLSKSYGGRQLFDRISFNLNPRERIGLVGRNGHGKTTLLRLITGEQAPDEGRVVVPRNYRLGYLTQTLEFHHDSVLAEAAAALPAPEADQLWKAKKVLAGLGFTEEDFGRPPSTLSGGFQVRLNLARVLISEPDLLLLDEPTNFLDITSIRWLEDFLSRWPRELMLITHDRGFMDQLVTHVVGIHRLKVRKVQGDTAKYYRQIAQEEEIHEKTRLNDERRQREIELFISRFRAKARLAGLVQSRIKTLAKLEKKEKLARLKTLEFQFRTSPFPGKHVFRAQGIHFAYPGRPPLIRDFNLTAAAGDRICIVGPNGQGKSTLIRLLAGALAPSAGSVTYHPEVRRGLLEQSHVAGLADNRTVEEEIMAAGGDITRQQARNICGAMLFSGDDALKPIGVLSGGEKSRVMLGKLLVTPLNLVFLDEPTNHLDMESCDALLAAIDSFEGTVVMVTHNEMFLHAVAERLVVFQGGRVEVFEGGYQAFLDQGGWQTEGAGPRSAGQTPAGPRASKKALRRERSAVIAEKSRRLGPLKEKIADLEKEIAAREKTLAGLQHRMQEASQAGDGERIADTARRLHACQSDIEALYARLEAVSGEHDQLQAGFDSRLAALDGELDRPPA